MRLSFPLLAFFCSSISLVLSGVAPKGNRQLHRELDSRSWCASLPAGTHERKEWRSLSKKERRDYINAVQCLRKKPSFYNEVTGCKSRYDDFQVLHIKQTFIIHNNAQFLPWHRWFTWTYEKALRNECGYQGFQPWVISEVWQSAAKLTGKCSYWDWTLDAANIEGSPLFDGSPYSMSGNGKAIAGRADITASVNLPPVNFAFSFSAGTGGGCVTTGPFANAEVPFGPVTIRLNASYIDNPKNLEHKPHCLSRDLNPKIVSTALKASSVDKLLQASNITSFINVLDQGPDPTTLNVHAGGHFGVGLDMSDGFASPGDPIFFLHHAQIDRIWALWQKKEPATRQYAITGTGTFFNYPPSPDVKLSDKIDLGKLWPEGPRPIKDFMDTKGGPFCYEYV